VKEDASFSDALMLLRAEILMQAIFPESKAPKRFLKKNQEVLKLIICKAA
jgi:hypothetical protein